MGIKQDIGQSKNFKNERLKAGVNILYTASWLTYQHNLHLRPFDISQQQFNLLRILKGMHPKPATVKLLTERMIDKTSNASRLVEKLRQKGLIQRHSCPMDRRKVDISITDRGLEVVDEASCIIENFVENNITVNEQEAKELNKLLDRLRG